MYRSTVHCTTVPGTIVPVSIHFGVPGSPNPIKEATENVLPQLLVCVVRVESDGQGLAQIRESHHSGVVITKIVDSQC
jgi:hypothetical protein